DPLVTGVQTCALPILIRALFLNRGKSGPGGRLQLGIAHEWDSLEKTLQSEDFWCFLSNDTEKRGGRIDEIFDLVSRQDGMKPSRSEERRVGKGCEWTM